MEMKDRNGQMAMAMDKCRKYRRIDGSAAHGTTNRKKRPKSLDLKR
jgi:hypothetical protein